MIAANRAIQSAQDDVEAARTDAAAHLVAVASGTAGNAPRSMREARNLLQDAEDQREATRAARDELKRQAETEAGDPESAATRLREAAARVLQAEWQGRADALVNDVIESYRALIEKAALVEKLARAGLFPTARDHRGQVVGPIEAMCRLPISNFMPGDAQPVLPAPSDSAACSTPCCPTQTRRCHERNAGIAWRAGRLHRQRCAR